MGNFLQLFGIGLELAGGLSAAKSAKKMGLKQAALELRVTKEKLYNLKQEERYVAGQTRATAAGSGVKADTGSPLSILAEQARTFARERMITSQVGAEKAQLSKMRGDMTSKQYKTQAWGKAAGDIGNMSPDILKAFGF